MPIQFITPSIISSVANTQVTGTITASQIATVNANTITSGSIPVAQIPQLTTAKMPTGCVLQVVSTTKTDSFSTTATSFTDVTGLSVSITPTSATSKILVICTILVAHAASRTASVNLVRNSTAICQPTPNSQTYSATKNAYIVNGDTATSADFHFLDSPATTSSTTYKVQVRTNVGDSAMVVGNRTVYNDMNSPCTITVMEIAA